MDYQNRLNASHTSNGLGSHVPVTRRSLVNLCVSDVTEFREPEIIA